MRILYHHRTLGDGAEGIHISEMVSAFRHLGHSVDVRGLAGPGVAEHRGRLAARIKAMMPTLAFEAAAIGTNALEFVAVQRTIRHARPDFLYARHARFARAALDAAQHAGVPAVLEVNCLFAAPSYKRFEPMVLGGWAALLERQALAAADVVLAVSTPLARQIREIHGVNAEVMPNGADPDRFDPARAEWGSVRCRLGLSDHITVGWVGVLREWHGLEALLEAVAKLPDVRLLLVGDGPARATVEQRARTLQLSDRLIITGRIPPNQMPAHIAAMDVAAVASDGTGVASPMKLLEYMAMARAVVAPRLDNIRDVLIDGSNGLLFRPDDSADLSAQLARLVADAGLRRELGARARDTVLRSRNWRRNAQRVIELVEAVSRREGHHPEMATQIRRRQAKR